MKSSNPLTYRDGISFTWNVGRQLYKIATEDYTVNMKYDTNGMRYCKTDGDYITNYYYDSQNNLIGLDKAGSTLFFYYDSNGTPTAFKNNDIMYYYIKNLQGDIVKIVNQDGTVVASYTYDAWGKILTIKDGSNVDVPSSNTFHVANLNPYRYRGYIYDNETGFYYLQTRYYDPITGRFLNADDTQCIQSEVLSSNLYTYCLNNPISYVDYSGKFGMFQPMGPVTIVDNIFNISDKISRSVYYSYQTIRNSFIMTVQMYLLALQNKNQNTFYDFSDQTIYIEKIKQSELYQNFVNDFLKNINLHELFEKMIHQHSDYEFIGKKTINFNHDTNRDLRYSIGDCSAFICVKKMNSYISATNGKRIRNYYLQVQIVDNYDFHIHQWNETSDFINNLLGYIPQEVGVLTSYHWCININYSYQHICQHGY